MKTNNLVNLGECISVSEVKENLSKNIDKEISIKEYKNKKLIREYYGVLKGIYSNLFTVQIDRKNLLQNKSFSYNDVSIGLLEYTIH